MHPRRYHEVDHQTGAPTGEHLVYTYLVTNSVRANQRYDPALNITMTLRTAVAQNHRRRTAANTEVVAWAPATLPVTALTHNAMNADMMAEALATPPGTTMRHQLHRTPARGCKRTGGEDTEKKRSFKRQTALLSIP